MFVPWVVIMCKEHHSISTILLIKILIIINSSGRQRDNDELIIMDLPQDVSVL